MRSSGRSVLSAVIVVSSLLVAACTTTSTIDADAPETAQNSAAQDQANEDQANKDQDRGVTAAPLPAATPTVSFDEAAVTLRQPPGDDAHDGLSELERAALAPSPLGIPSTTDRYPLWSGSPVNNRENDLVSVNYDEPPTKTRIGLPSEPFHRTVGITPDGTRAWLNIADPSGAITCPEGATGTVLTTMPLDSSEPPRFAQPHEELPANVSDIHSGPEDHVLIYSTCGHYSSPAAFAQVSANGDFTNVRPLDPALHSILFVYPPRWIWATEQGGEYSYEDTGRLVAIIPQYGMSAPGDVTHGRADIYIDVESGEILDMYPSETTVEATVGYHQVTGSLESLLVGTNEVPGWTGPVWLLRAQTGFAEAGLQTIAAAGEDGAMLITFSGFDEFQSELISDAAASDIQWAPSGRALAVSDADGTRLRIDDRTFGLSPAAGRLFFSADGSTLVLASQETEIFTFQPVDVPDDTNQITPFSQLDSGGLGPIRIDMLVSDLHDKLDIETTRTTAGAGPVVGSCVWISSPQLGPISMLGEATSEDDAIIRALRVDNGPWTTPSGLRVGSTEREVRVALAGQFTEYPHVYVAGNYLFYVPSDANDPYGVKFETNGNETFAITVGNHDWISLVEGCA